MIGGFDDRAIAALGGWILAEALQRPFARDEALWIDAEGAPERMRRAELVARLRGDGLSSLARRAERWPVPLGHVLVLVLGHVDGPLVATFPAEKLAEEHGAPASRAIPLSIAPVGALGGRA